MQALACFMVWHDKHDGASGIRVGRTRWPVRRTWPIPLLQHQVRLAAMTAATPVPQTALRPPAGEAGGVVRPIAARPKSIDPHTTVDASGARSATEMLDAIIENDPARVKVLLERGVDPDVIADDDGVTPLMIAAAMVDRTAIVQLLIEHGADVNASCNEGMTPLMYASHPDVVRELIRRGADVNARDRSGTPVRSFMGDPVSIELLINAGAEE